MQDSQKTHKKVSCLGLGFSSLLAAREIPGLSSTRIEQCGTEHLDGPWLHLWPRFGRPLHAAMFTLFETWGKKTKRNIVMTLSHNG